MCGSCALVVNGREMLACKTSVAQIPRGLEITLRPLNHFPVIKDLMVDMSPLSRQFQESLAFFEPLEPAAEPARIPPRARERSEASQASDCIACGCCVSSCTQCQHESFAGPAALLRSFSLLTDSRDGIFQPRLERSLASCAECRTELNCTEACPKGLSGTQAIKGIQLLAWKQGLSPRCQPEARCAAASAAKVESAGRRNFLRQAAAGAVATGAALFLGGSATRFVLGPTPVAAPSQWVRVGSLGSLPEGKISTVTVNYQVTNGPYTETVALPVLVSREGVDIVCFHSDCPHLGCRVLWDEALGAFRCTCHGGRFDRTGGVMAGPPPRPLDRYRSKVESGDLFVEAG
jgi:succinate dehydrogenase / fumarate reductase iron-sulfur subunit